MSGTQSAPGEQSTAVGRRHRAMLLWVGGMSAGIFAAAEASTWALAALRTWWLGTMSAMFLAPMALAQAPPSGAAGSQALLHDEIVKVAEVYRRAVLAGDAQAVAAAYSDDGVELPPHHPLVRGRAAIERRFHGLFKESKMTAFTFTHLAASVDGSTAYDAGTYEQRLTLPTGQMLDDTGKYLAILKRAGGAWKLAYLAYNSDLPAIPCSASASVAVGGDKD